MSQVEQVERLLKAELGLVEQRSNALGRSLLAAAFSGRLAGRASDLDLAEELARA